MVANNYVASHRTQKLCCKCISNAFCGSPAVGRWGLACATQDNKVAFAGGKAYGSTVKRTTDGTAAADNTSVIQPLPNVFDFLKFVILLFAEIDVFDSVAKSWYVQFRR